MKIDKSGSASSAGSGLDGDLLLKRKVHSSLQPSRASSWICFVVLALLGWIFLAEAQAADFEEPFRVLILRNTSQYVPAAIVQDRGMRDAFSALKTRNVELFVETMDTMWFDRSEIEPEFLSLFRKKYGTRKIDLLIAAGADALEAAQRLRESLQWTVPIVFYNIAEDALRGRAIQSNTVGLALRFDLPGTLDLAVRLQPDARHIVVVSGTSSYDRNWLRRAREALRRYESRLVVSYWSGLRLPQLLEHLRKLSPDTMVLYLAFSDDGSGHNYSPADVAKWIAAASAAPVYGVLESYLGLGIVGGVFPSFESHGRLAGELAVRVLSGEKSESIAVRPAPQPVVNVDWRELRRWSIDAKRLPPGSIVQFRQLSFWEQYRWYIAAALAIIVVQAALITDLLLQHSRRRRSEMDLQRNREQLAHVTRVSTMGELAASLAHELNQPLTAILSNAQAAQRFLNAEPADLVHSDGILRNIRVEIECQEGLPSARGDRVQLQQVVLNLLVNAFDAMKDAPASERKVVMRAKTNGADTVEVSVRDRGIGLTSDELVRIFQPFYTTKRDGLGMGLPISRSIIEAHGGRLWAESSVDLGSTFYFTIPATGDEASLGTTVH